MTGLIQSTFQHPSLARFLGCVPVWAASLGQGHGMVLTVKRKYAILPRHLISILIRNQEHEKSLLCPENIISVVESQGLLIGSGKDSFSIHLDST